MRFDVAIVGGGHAGIEAAHAAARLGCSVALLLPNPAKIGLMPCNPAIGGPGKSQLVFELHALGGVMGRLADQTAIHARTLNASKGPAVQSLRVQNERDGYAAAARSLIEATPGVTTLRGEVAQIDADQGRVTGLTLTDGRVLRCQATVLCTGTFLAGVVWYGQEQRAAGRQGEAPARHLSQSLRHSGHRLLRFKTGTPPRIRADSVDFGTLEPVPPDDPPASFSGTPGPRVTASPTWLTHTTAATHLLINDNLERSAMYGGALEGQGPRYCPSIEDKVVRFADKDRHLLFVEPDGIDTSEVYLQGFSSSLPPVLQDDMIRTLPGFERAVIHRYAYAVEYDVLDPNQLDTQLMSRRLPGLFSAGQINGTSGYEEAAAQGWVAGVNAARYAQGLPPLGLRRDQGYIGVLLDDLVRWGLDEPYRMLTSRNEYRLLHRQDNAQARLSPIGNELGLVDAADYARIQASLHRVEAEVERFRASRVDGAPASTVICRPNQTYSSVAQLLGPAAEPLIPAEQTQVEIQLKYAAYIDRSRRELESRHSYDAVPLSGLDYDRVPSLSSEGRANLRRHRPGTLGAAQRLRGVRDSDITALVIHLKAASRRQAKGPSVSRETSTSG